MTDELKPCPFCGHEPDLRISDTDGNKYYTCGSKWCRNGNWYTLEEWITRPLEDALQARIAELEAENKALKLIANSHSMSELRRNQILAGDKWFKYPPAPERKEQ